MSLIELSHRPRRRRRPMMTPLASAGSWRRRLRRLSPCPWTSLRAPLRRTARVAFARQSAMYLAHVALGLSSGTVGRMFRRDRTTAAHACQLVERRRDDPAFDRPLDMLEGVCAELAREIQTRRQVRR
jgi:hypothetical protein